jgi:hypothetical protein
LAGNGGCVQRWVEVAHSFIKMDMSSILDTLGFQVVPNDTLNCVRWTA